MKKIKLYQVSVLENNKLKLLTIVSNKKDAKEYATNYLRLEKSNHFLRWCDSQKLNPQEDKSWYIYCVNCLEKFDLNKFRVKSFYVSLLDIAESYRVLGGAQPLGLSYEGPLEIGFLITSLEKGNNPALLNQALIQAKLNKGMEKIISNCNIKAEEDGE